MPKELTEKEINNIIDVLIPADIKAGKLEIINGEDHRIIRDTLTHSIIIPITQRKDMAMAYTNLILNPPAKKDNADALFDALPRVSMFIGQPDTGKTYEALSIARECGVPSILKMCRDTLNLETLLEDFELIDGKPNFKESMALKMLTGTEKCIIILDEFNTLLTGVMKTTQPLFDNTSTEFEYKGTVYKKNMNCKFIVTLNDKDKGISIVPDAILSRCRLKWFTPVVSNTLADWTNVPLEWIKALQKIYKICGVLNVFGTRQIQILYGQPIDEIKNHLESLCRMKNVDPKIVTTIQIQTHINKLIV